MSRKPFPSELRERFTVKLPDGLLDRLKAHAKERQRSVNAEIVRAILRHIDPKPASKMDPGLTPIASALLAELRHLAEGESE